MEEINKVKEMITDIFENSAKMTKILQEREAATCNTADEEQRHQINVLLDSFQLQEKRMQKGDDAIQELENMVRDLMPRVEQASSLVMNYTRQLSEGRNRCIPRDLSTIGRRSRGQQHYDGGSEHLFQRGIRDMNIQNVITGQNTDRNAEKHESEKKTNFGDDSVHSQTQSMNSVILRESSVRMKFGCNGENENAVSKRKSRDNRESDSTYHTFKVPVNEYGFKTRQTPTEVDNRLHYFRKFETKRRENKHTTEEGKEKNIAQRIHLGPTHSDSLTRDEAMLEHTKDGIARKSETAKKSVKGNDDVFLSSSSREEVFKRVKEDPDLAEQNTDKEGLKEIEILMKNNMEASAYLGDMMEKADIEKTKGIASRLPRGLGPSTVLCLDTSGSMAGPAFREMISLANGFVEGIRHVSQNHGIADNIAVCTFGKKTGVRLHLTNQYDKVQEVLLTLQPEGPSPMYEGILMALAACLGNGRRCLGEGILAENRIILISDGKGTPDHWNLIGDTVDPNNAAANSLVDSYISFVGELAKRWGHAVYSVPVGDFTENNMAQVARKSGGRIIKKTELSHMILFTQLQKAAANAVLMCRDLDEEVDREPFLRAIIGVEVESTTHDEPFLKQHKMDILTMALKFTKRQLKDHKGNKGDVMEEVNTYMPCIGTRVRRGPNWKRGNQDCKGPGTVVGHDSDKSVWVDWDLGGRRDVYSYLPGIHDVTVVDEERVLMAGEEIGVGCKVKRGKNWSFGDQDGGVGTVGVVCRVDPANTVHVRWPNKTVKRYNFGANGRFDVELINQRESIVTSDFILPPRRRESSIADNGVDARSEISIKT